MPCTRYDTVRYDTSVLWVILLLELIFEILIRPNDYKQLMKSDKAFWPSTARYINTMYVVGEAFALLTYVPEIICLSETLDVCLTRHNFIGSLTLVKASGDAVLGPTRFDSIMGRVVLGSMAFRFFGVIRHWKQMLINQTYHPVERQGIEKWVIPYDPNNTRQKRRRRRIENKEDVSVCECVCVYGTVVVT